MADFLTPVSTTTVKRNQSFAPSSEHAKSSYSDIDSPETCLNVLKAQPDFETVLKALSHLDSSLSRSEGFSLATPGPLSAQIINELVTTTIPDYWRTFRDSGRGVPKLIKCLQNVSGIGAIMSRLRPLIADCRRKKSVDETRDSSQHLEDLLEVLSRILKQDNISVRIWESIQAHAQSDTQGKLLWKEYISLVASGKVLSISAQSEDALKEREPSRDELWISNGNEYASWIGRNIGAILSADASNFGSLSQFCGKALTLGYNGEVNPPFMSNFADETDRLVTSVMTAVLDRGLLARISEFLPKLAAHEQRQFLNSAITFLSKKYLGSLVESKEGNPSEPLAAVSGVAFVIQQLIRDNEILKDHIVEVLTRSTISTLDDSLSSRRSVIAAIVEDQDRLQSVMEKSLSIFGDKFYTMHTPIIKQEALAQTLTISCGYVHRKQPISLIMITKSSTHTSAISNRIGASAPRARLLGMYVGVAISMLVDKPELRLKFEFEGDFAAEAQWHQQLTQVDDKIGQLHDLRPREMSLPSHVKSPANPMRHKAQGKAPTKPVVTEITGPRIVEVLSESEDDDLVPYEKPDSDPEDDEDDPTMLDRNKPTAPVYIRDLITYLSDQENYDRQLLGLQTAAPLIRRKANFGSEVTDHIEQLANVLLTLNDNFDIPNFAELRQQALIAVLLAKPAPMAQYLARSFFTGDYSLTQRIAMLTTLGLGARELAGFTSPSETPIPIPATPSFPSKTLPPRLHKIYAAETAPVAALTKQLEKATLEPMALSAADKLSGPDVLKVRTFSSRIEVEKKRKKAIPNALAQIVADNFFFPLTGRWCTNISQSGSAGTSLLSLSLGGSEFKGARKFQDADSGNLYTSPHLLPPFLQTLALLLHASGPNTLSLPQMTREFWDLLLSVRGVALRDKEILRALLFSFLMLLETNEDKERLVAEQAKELLETQEWVRGVFEELGAGKRVGLMGIGGVGKGKGREREEGGVDEDERLRALAAGVLVRCGEVIEAYRRRLVGVLGDV